jgi:hypothetical protein
MMFEGPDVIVMLANEEIGTDPDGVSIRNRRGQLDSRTIN